MDDNPWGVPTTPSPRSNRNDVDPIQILRLSVGDGSNEPLTSAMTSSPHWDASRSPSLLVKEQGHDVEQKQEPEQEQDEKEEDAEEEVSDEQTVEEATPAPSTEPETSSTHEANDDDDDSEPAHDDDKDKDDKDKDKDKASERFSSPPPPPAAAMVQSPSTPLVLPPMEEGPPMDDFDDDESGPTPATPVPELGHDFDDFGEAVAAGGDDDDDFGDFGDFDQTTEGDTDGFEGFGEPPTFTEASVRPSAHDASSSFAAFQSTGHPPLLLDLTDPSKSAIAEQLQQFFEGIYPGAQNVVSDEPERQVEGVSQVLASESTRTLLADLLSLPALKPLDWRRSRIRREHLIVLGVPINLDDTAPVKLASLTLPSQRSKSPHTTRSPTSALSAGGSISRSTSPFTERERARAQHYQAPILDRRLAESLLALKEDDLLGMSLASLQTKLREMERVTEDASAALTHALVSRDKESSDAETYNGMIQDLVAAAAKTKTTSAVGGRSSPALRTASGRWGRSAVK
ncbi:BQ2448_4320 [Microbotryum intermedium]|uniref:BQ2448_4320 protein n=1 Tax=Microbotryum intermedium TaxID=269621 RepID=A0A238FL90_9BASI|nr:BQ2448_4320 [Microbotryum intermedium]